jgi:prepilin-type N-terminal cleavage/methylation domain-containing protein
MFSVLPASLRKLNRQQRRRLAQAGFTLLELLVVVAILAAVAGTATIVLQDTDRRAAAAAHVAMMDELKKGVATFSVLRQGLLPDNYDSLLENPTTPALFSRLATSTAGMLEVLPLEATAPGVVDALATLGITHTRIIDTAAVPAGAGSVADCTNVQLLVNDKTGGTVIHNVYNAASASGCGVDYPFGTSAASTVSAAFWIGGQRRVLGAAEPEISATPNGDAAVVGTTVATPTAANQRLLMAVGFGPSSSLFDGKIGSLSTVPAYRHTAPDEYNRFIGLYAVAVPNAAATAWVGQNPELVAVIDGAGDTKEEEIGEFDGTRSTI